MKTIIKKFRVKNDPNKRRFGSATDEIVYDEGTTIVVNGVSMDVLQFTGWVIAHTKLWGIDVVEE